MGERLSKEQLTAALVSSIPIVGHMGVTVVDVGPGYAVTRLPLAANGNHYGVAYAGSLATAAEVLGGVIAGSTLDLEGYFPLVRDFSIDFRRPATSDVTARASLDDAEVDRIRVEALTNGKADFELHATITDAAGDVVATTTGHYQVRRVVR
ncbi:MAG TPA: YiiD C-terminal domain-containing protein [Nocardioides sp.]|nr:YiiD C-terminal domain-containing protein [Nocardioides sp.]